MNDKGYNILVIEDNPGDFILVEDFLFEQIKFPKVTHARDFGEARELLKGPGAAFSVILLDLSLPDFTGEPLIQGIVDLAHDIPIVVLTGYTDFSFGLRSLSMGISDYLLKDDLTSLSLYKSIVYSIERKKNLEDLMESEKRYSDVFHFSPLPMWVVDVNSLKFLDVNEATINNYGYSKGEFLAMTLKDITPAEGLANLEEGLKEGKENPDKIITRIALHKKKDGELRDVEIQIAPFQYKKNRANIVVANDITETQNYIKAIEDHNYKLKEIAWIQSHLVRAPLARILGLVPIIETSNSEEERMKMIQYLTEAANELDTVIKQITDKTLPAQRNSTFQ